MRAGACNSQGTVVSRAVAAVGLAAVGRDAVGRVVGLLHAWSGTSGTMGVVTSSQRRSRGVDRAHDAQVHEELKRLERARLFRIVMPLIAAGVGVSWLYAWLALTSDLTPFWFGPGFAGLGAVSCSVGYALRLREARSPVEPPSRHYAWMFLGGLLVLLGALVPPYALA